MCDAECGRCGQPPKFKCERCLEPYCSSECQVADWQEHKGKCYKFPNLIPMHMMKSISTLSVKSDTQSKRSHGASAVNLNESRRGNTSTFHQKSHNPIGDVGTPQNMGGAKPKRVLEDKDFALMPKMNVPPLPAVQTEAASSAHLSTAAKSFNWRIPYPPPGDFFEAIVQFVEENSERFIWVTDAKYDSPLRKLMSEINRNINQAVPCSPELIVPGALVAAPLNKILYRAEVLNISADAKRADIRLIDYGNELRVPYSQIFAPIPIMVNLNAYALRVRVSNECGPLELESVLNIRVVGEKTSDGYYNIECKAKTIPLHLDVEALTKEESLTFVKCFVDGHNALFRLSSAKDLNMDTVLNSAQALQYDFENVPIEGSFVAARTAHGWKRACLLGCYTKEHKFLVYTIDEGYIQFSSQIKRIPDAFTEQPMKVFAVSTSSTDYMLCETMLVTAKKLSLKLLPTSSVAAGKDPKTHLSCALFDDTRKIVDAVIASVFTGCLEQLGLKLWHDQIAEGSNVFVSNVITYKEIWLASNNTMEYPTIIKSECAKCKPFEATDTISNGDMVVVYIRADNSYRGEIICSENNSYKVKNVDRGWEQVVQRNCLLNPTPLLRALPVGCSLAKLMYLESVPTPIANNKALAALETCMKNYTEFYVTYANDSRQSVDLLFQTKDRQSLCKKLLPMVFEPCDEVASASAAVSQIGSAKSAPLPLTPPVTPTVSNAPATVQPIVSAKNGPYTLDDLEIIPISCGEQSALYVLDATTLLNMEGPYITAADYGNKKFLAKMEKYLLSVGTYCTGPTSPKGGYAPKKMELCLSVFAEDGEWYRALCIDHHPNEAYVVMFLDYGNVAKVNKKDLMPITPELMFPSNANMVYIKDITSKEHALKFAKATQENPIISANVVRLSENDAYFAEVHGIEKLIT